MTTSDGRLHGKRAVVTGAGSGIGRATAQRFAHEGARVGLIDRDDRAIRSVAETIEAVSGEVVELPTDLTVEEDVRRSIEDAAERWGGALDVVVANAGVQLFGEDARVHELDTQVWDRTMAVNLRGAMLTCKYGVRALLAAGGGSVIFTGSPTGMYGQAPGFDAYSASKGGVLGLARVMAIDYAADGIRVNVVVPGFTNTPLVTDIVGDEGWLSTLNAKIPLGRPGAPEEIASMMVFLASDEASYATGGFFFVDGGFSAY